MPITNIQDRAFFFALYQQLLTLQLGRTFHTIYIEREFSFIGEAANVYISYQLFETFLCLRKFLNMK